MLAWTRVGAVVALALAFVGPLAFVGTAADAQTLARQKEALQAIEEAADHLCMTVPIQQTNKSLELSGGAKAELKGLSAKVAGLGIGGAAKSVSGTSSGVLQKDLAAAIQEGNDCKIKVFTTLQKTMLPTAAPAPRSAPTPPKARSPVVAAQPAPATPDARPQAPVRHAEAAAPAPAPPPPQITATVQFFPRHTNINNMVDVDVDTCVQTERNVVCTIYVTATGGRGPSWMMDRKSTIQDENGIDIAPSLITVGSFAHDPNQGGKSVPLSIGTRTRVLYSYDNVADATKLQTFNLTVCCIRNVSLHRQ